MFIKGANVFSNFTETVSVGSVKNILDGVDWYIVSSLRGKNLVKDSGVTSTNKWVEDGAESLNTYPGQIRETSITDQHRIYQSGIYIENPDVYYTLSLRIRQGTGSARKYFKLMMNNNQQFGFSNFAIFDIESGSGGTVFSTGSAIETQSISDDGDGWYRCWIQGKSLGPGNCYIALNIVDNDGSTISYTGTGSTYYEVDEVQFEITPSGSPAPTSYEETGQDYSLYNALIDQKGNGLHMKFPSGDYYNGNTNDPIFINHVIGYDHVWFPGVTGNYLAVPDSAPLSITGDIEIQLFIEPDSWTPSSAQVPLSKDGAGSYRTVLNTDGTVGITVDGVFGYISTVAPGFNKGNGQWLKFTLDVDNGGGNSVAQIFTGGSDITSASWAQLGSDITSTTTSFADTTGQLYLGQRANGLQMFAGSIYRAIIKDGIDGTVVFDFSASDWEVNEYSMIENSVNAAEVTMSRSATGYRTLYVDQPMFAFATDDFMYADANDLFNIGTDKPFSAIAVFRGQPDNGSLQSVFGSREGTTQEGWAIYLGNATNTFVAVDANGGSPGDSVTITGSWAQHAVGLTYNRSVASQYDGEVEVVYNGTGSGSPETFTSHSQFVSTDQLRIGAYGKTLGSTPGYFADVAFIGAAIKRGKNLSDKEFRVIASALIAKNKGEI